MPRRSHWRLVVAAIRCWGLFAATSLMAADASAPPRIGQESRRRGDELCVCGRFFHVGSPVVLWLDPYGYDAYRVERRFAPPADATWQATQAQVPALSSPNRYGSRRDRLTDLQAQAIDERGWDLETLQTIVDQFVLHYDLCGTSRLCFRELHDQRGLSVHFLLDVDGTIYQTLDLKERAWHATTSNSRSIGIEIAQIGAYPAGKSSILDRWYAPTADPNRGAARTQLVLPKSPAELGIRTANFVGFPIRPERITGIIQEQQLEQYDFTAQQYDALIRLTAALCRIFPQLRCDYPRDAEGKLIPHKLPDPQLRQYQGLLGHYHVQANKIDPGPAFQWDYLIEAARAAGQR